MSDYATRLNDLTACANQNGRIEGLAEALKIIETIASVDGSDYRRVMTAILEHQSRVIAGAGAQLAVAKARQGVTT